MPEAQFDVEVAAGPDGLGVQVLATFGAGEQPRQPFLLPPLLNTPPVQRADVARWIAAVAGLPWPASGPAPEAPALRQAAETIGAALFATLLPDELRGTFRTSRAAARVAGQRLQLRLRLPDELALLPWELLFDPQDGQHLALASDLALLRYMPLPTPVALRPIEGPVRALALFASPQDQPPLALAREREQIAAVLAARQITCDVVQGHDTLSQLRRQLRQPTHLLHLTCHGEVDEAASEGVLLWEDADGAADAIGTALLRGLVQGQREHLRLVVLNSCASALPADQPLSSMGAALVRGGLAAVIGMQFAINDTAATVFSSVLYDELANNVPLDAALSAARLALSHRAAPLAWAVPVLFSRADVPITLGVAAGEAAHDPAATPPLVSGGRATVSGNAKVYGPVVGENSGDITLSYDFSDRQRRADDGE